MRRRQLPTGRRRRGYEHRGWMARIARGVGHAGAGRRMLPASLRVRCSGRSQ
jgi:hypothetical protein